MISMNNNYCTWEQQGFLFFNEKYGVYLINVNKIDYIGQRQSSKKINIFENSQKV